MSLHKIFFSYSRNDAGAFATKLASDLKQAGFNVWIDQQDIRAGTEWDIEIEKALETCDCLLFIESTKSVVSNNVLDEVYYALGQNKVVIPVIFNDSKTPFRLQRLQHIDLSKDYQSGLVNLINELNSTNQTNTKPITPVGKSQLQHAPFVKKYSMQLLVTVALALISTVAYIIYSANKEKITDPAVVTTNKAADTLQPSKQSALNELPIAPETTATKIVTETERQKKKSLKIIDNTTGKKNTVSTETGNNKKENIDEPPAFEAESFAGNWQLTGLEPAQASHTGYIKIEALTESKIKLTSHFQFYFHRPATEAYFVVFNGFASSESCTLKNEINITNKDISIGTNRYTILKKDVPGEGKAGDTVATQGGNSTVSAAVTLQLLNSNSIIIKVYQPAATPISNGFTVPPFTYLFRFKKSI